MLPIALLLLAAQNPNDPGILDPVIEHYTQSDLRLPGSDQVQPPSELVNIVGTRRRPIPGAQSATGAPIAASGTESPNRDLGAALEGMDDATLQGNASSMRAWAAEARSILLGTTQGRIYDGFPMLEHDRGAWHPDHLPGEHLAKRAVDSGRRARGPGGRAQILWTVAINVLMYDDEMDSDTAFVLIPPQAHPLDRLIVQWTLYSSEGDTFIPTTVQEDFSPFGEGMLPSKSYDATWVVVDPHEVLMAAVDMGTVGNLRGLQAWRWRPQRPCAIFIQPVFERSGPGGAILRDARGTAAMELRRGHGPDAVGAAAPERKVLEVAEAALAGAAPAVVRQMMNDPQTPPFGTWRQWEEALDAKDQLLPETWQALAQEGITPGMADPLGPYDVVMAWANHELYVMADDAVVRDPLTGRPIPQAADQQGARIAVKVFNHDAAEHFLQVEDYGPPLHDDIGTCSNAPGGSHSLEIFNRKPIFGAPKVHELQWRAAYGVRRGLGFLQPYDMFPQVEEQNLLTPFTDPLGSARLGWSWPADLRGADFVVRPASEWLGGPGAFAEPGFADGLRIGATTPGFGVARMPAGDLSAFHPDGWLNADTDGDQVYDALIFPAWMRNPATAGGDLIPTTPDFEPFLWLSPENGTPWLDPADRAAGPWAARTYGFGMPVAAGAAESFTVVRPRFTGQGLWYSDGLWRDMGVGVTHHHENEY